MAQFNKLTFLCEGNKEREQREGLECIVRVNMPQPNTPSDSPNCFLKIPLFVIIGPRLLLHKLFFLKIICIRTNKKHATKLTSLLPLDRVVLKFLRASSSRSWLSEESEVLRN